MSKSMYFKLNLTEIDEMITNLIDVIKYIKYKLFMSNLKFTYIMYIILLDLHEKP